MTPPNPGNRQRARHRVENQARELRQQIHALAERHWQEPVVVVCLGYLLPKYDVPGRRRDGAVKAGRKPAGRRILSKVLYWMGGGLILAVLAAMGASWSGFVSASKRKGWVTGPENALALGFADAARSGLLLWLVYSARSAGDPADYSPSHVALVATFDFVDPAGNQPPKFVWHAAKPHTPLISPERRRLTWPDGSMFQYPVGDEKRVFLLQSIR